MSSAAAGNAAAAAAAADADARHDVPCVRCGYSLRGHDADGRCPECGLPAYWSLRAPQNLAQFPPGWVTAMAWGARLAAVAYGGVFAFLAAASLQLLPNRHIDEMLIAAMAAGTVFQAAGMWLLARHSRHASEPPRPVNRRTLRLASLGALVGAGAAAWGEYNSSHLVEFGISAIIVCTVVAAPAAFLRLRSVARLISNTSLAEHSAIVAWGCVLTAAAWGAFALMEMSGVRADASKLRWLALIGLLCLGVLLFLLWGAFIMACCVIDFGRAAKVARAEWKARDADAGD